METLGTIVAGVIVYVICEYLKEIWLQPLQDYKRLKAEISRLLVFYASLYISQEIYISETKENEKAAHQFRNLASEVAAFSEQICPFRLGIPDKETFAKVRKNLIGISNSFFASTPEAVSRRSDDNEKRANEIKRLLTLNFEM